MTTKGAKNTPLPGLDGLIEIQASKRKQNHSVMKKWMFGIGYGLSDRGKV